MDPAGGPELDRELRDAMVEGCEEAADGRTIADLVAERDQGVIDVLRATGRLPGGGLPGGQRGGTA